MDKRIRFALVFALFVGMGALYQAVPFFAMENAATQSNFKLDLSYRSASIAQPQVVVNDYQYAEQGSFFLQRDGQSGYQLSPLLDTQVSIDVTGLVARATVTQIFNNNSEHWVNGIYVFPLPESAAVDHLTMQIGERLIEGQIQPKEKAKALYEQAKREGKKASLLEQQRPNLFKNSIANIGPGETITVTIEYQQAVSYDSGEFSLRFPTTVSTRYLPNPQTSDNTEIADSGWAMTQPTFKETATKAPLKADPQAEQDHAPLNKVAIELSLRSGFELERVHSQFHPVHVEQLPGHNYKVTLQQEMIANQDFVVSWRPHISNAPKAAHFASQIGDSHYGAIMLMPPEPQQHNAALAREVIYILDTSGSMAGESLQQAKLALNLAIDSLTANDTFNLIEFDSTARKIWPVAKPAQQINKGAVKSFIDDLVADGGTEMRAALQLGLGGQDSNADAKRIRQVVFITDGSVGNEPQLFEYIHQNLGKSRLFTVGIGAAPNSFFMTEAARMGKGTFTYIGSVEQVQKSMQALFTKLQNPVLADLEAGFPAGVEFYPAQLPDLYQGEPVMISYKSPRPLAEIRLSGSLRDQYWQKNLAVNNGAKESGLDVLWARRKIAQLGRDKLMGQDHDTINKAIEQVAMDHHLVSEMTSLVAVDVSPTAQAISQDVAVKNQLPKGFDPSHGSLPQTATNAPIQWLLAFILLGLGLCTVIFTKGR